MSRPPKRIVRSTDPDAAGAPPQATGKGRYMTPPEPVDDDRQPPQSPPAPSPSFTKGRHMTVYLPGDDDESVVVDDRQDVDADYVEPYVPSPSFNKYDRRASGARAAEPHDDAPPVAEPGPSPAADPAPSVGPEPSGAASPDADSGDGESQPAADVGPETDYVEPYVPAPIWNKYDRRASGAASRAPTQPSPPELSVDAVDGPTPPSSEASTAVESDPDQAPPGEHLIVDLTDGDATAPLSAAPATFETPYDRELREMEERAAAERAARVNERIDPFADPNELTYWQRHSAGLPRLEEESD